MKSKVVKSNKNALKPGFRIFVIAQRRERAQAKDSDKKRKYKEKTLEYPADVGLPGPGLFST